MRWWDEHHATLESVGHVDRFDRFTVANTSGPTSLFRSVGGFDERFVEYGFEDFELGYRLLAADVTILFDGDAIAWHPDVVSRSQMIARNRHVGANSARLVRMHPEAEDSVFPNEPSPAMSLLRRIHVRRPRAL